jgi:hypothetical protein
MPTAYSIAVAVIADANCVASRRSGAGIARARWAENSRGKSDHVTIEGHLKAVYGSRGRRPVHRRRCTEHLLDLPVAIEQREGTELEGQPFRSLEVGPVADVKVQMGRARGTRLAELSDNGAAPDFLPDFHRQAAGLQMGIVREDARSDLQHHEVSVKRPIRQILGTLLRCQWPAIGYSVAGIRNDTVGHGEHVLPIAEPVFVDGRRG